MLNYDDEDSHFSIFRLKNGDVIKSILCKLFVRFMQDSYWLAFMTNINENEEN